MAAGERLFVGKKGLIRLTAIRRPEVLEGAVQKNETSKKQEQGGGEKNVRQGGLCYQARFQGVEEEGMNRSWRGKK